MVGGVVGAEKEVVGEGVERSSRRDNSSGFDRGQLFLRNSVANYPKDANAMAEDIDLDQRLKNLEEEIRLLKESVFPLIADIRARVLSPGDEF